MDAHARNEITEPDADSRPQTPPVVEPRGGDGRVRAVWAWWGVSAGALGLAGNFVATHGTLERADAAMAVSALDRTGQHLGTIAGMGAFVSLLMLSAGWRRWAGAWSGLAEQAMAPAFLVTATLVLFGTGLRGGMAEYLPGGTNDDNFVDEGLYVLFMVHDTAPWFAWWGVVVAAGLVVALSLGRRLLPRWLGVLSAVAVVLPVVVMVGSGAVAGAGLVGPVWLVLFSVVIAVRGVPATGRP